MHKLHKGLAFLLTLALILSVAVVPGLAYDKDVYNID